MIITSKLNELAIHSQVIGGGLQVWRDVHLETESPYFMVIYSVREANRRVRQTCLIWQQEDLVSLCSGQLIPDTWLSFSSATAGARPSLN